MKMLMVVYSGTNSQRVAMLLDSHHTEGYTEFRNAHGVGDTGRRDGSRAWPGESTLFVSVVPELQATELVDALCALRDEMSQQSTGERLHAAVLPADSFF
jgi:hypothetical protein